MEQPEKVDLEVTVMGGSTLSGLIPSLKAWLVGFARDSLISMYVMPEHWTYRIDPVSPSFCLNCSAVSLPMPPQQFGVPELCMISVCGMLWTILWLVRLLSIISC